MMQAEYRNVSFFPKTVPMVIRSTKFTIFITSKDGSSPAQSPSNLHSTHFFMKTFLHFFSSGTFSLIILPFTFSPSSTNQTQWDPWSSSPCFKCFRIATVFPRYLGCPIPRTPGITFATSDRRKSAQFNELHVSRFFIPWMTPHSLGTSNRSCLPQL